MESPAAEGAWAWARVLGVRSSTRTSGGLGAETSADAEVDDVNDVPHGEMVVLVGALKPMRIRASWWPR